MQEGDRRAFMAGCLAAGVVSGFDLVVVDPAEAMAAAARAAAQPEDAVVYFVRDGRQLVFPATHVWAESRNDEVEKVTLWTRDNQLIHLPAGEFWVEVDGQRSHAFRRRPCTAHPLASF